MRLLHNTLFLTLVVALSFTLIYFGACNRKDVKKPAAGTPPDWSVAYAEQQRSIFKWKERALAAEDSTVKLNTQLAAITVELNRSESALQKYSTQYKKAKVSNAVPQMLFYCDSMAAELTHERVENWIRREQLADSINGFYERIIDYKDSLILVCDSSTNTAVAELKEAQIEKAIAEDKLHKSKKKAGIGWIAAAAASVIAFLTAIAK